MSDNTKEEDRDMIMGLACPPLDNFFGFSITNVPDYDLSVFFDDFDDNGNPIVNMPEPSSSSSASLHLLQDSIDSAADEQRLIDEIFECFSNPLSEPMLEDDISGTFFDPHRIKDSITRASSPTSHHSIIDDRAEEKKTLKPRALQHHGKGKEMKVLLESRKCMKKPQHGQCEQANIIDPRLFNVNTKSSSSVYNTQTKRRAAPTDDQDDKFESTAKKLRCRYEEAFRAKRQRQIVVVDSRQLLPKPKSCRRFKSRMLQRLYQKC